VGQKGVPGDGVKAGEDAASGHSQKCGPRSCLGGGELKLWGRRRKIPGERESLSTQMDIEEREGTNWNVLSPFQTETRMSDAGKEQWRSL